MSIKAKPDYIDVIKKAVRPLVSIIIEIGGFYF
jgi:hypothetical protein